MLCERGADTKNRLNHRDDEDRQAKLMMEIRRGTRVLIWIFKSRIAQSERNNNEDRSESVQADVRYVPISPCTEVAGNQDCRWSGYESRQGTKDGCEVSGRGQLCCL